MDNNKWFDSESVNELYPGAVMIPPMKIGNFPGTKGKTLEDVCNSGEYFANIKKDGAFYSYNKTSGKSYLFGRTKSVKTGLLTEKSANVPHIIDFLDSFIPEDTILIGEIYYPHKTSKDTVSVMGGLPETAAKRQEKLGLIHYYIHDILMLEGELLLDKSNRTRYFTMRELFEDTSLPDFIEIADIFEDCNLLEVAETALGEGEEGIVLKRKDGKYFPDKRPAWETIKIKKHDTADVVCLGFEEPEKEYKGKELEFWSFNFNGAEPGQKLKGTYSNLLKQGYDPIPVTKAYYYGWKNAINIGCYVDGTLQSIGTVASGLTDDLRWEFAEHPEKYIGKVVEVSVMEKMDGTLRHPVFERFRDDKEAEECTYDSIFK